MSRRQLFVLITTILGTSIAILDSTIVNLALPKIGKSLHVGFNDFQWIADGYLLSLSALILLGGSLGDILGRKKVYLIGVGGFGVCSLLCALATTGDFLIFYRIIQGVFAALMVPGALSIINTNFPRKIRSIAIGRWTAFTSIAAVVGPLIGGLILDITTWRWIFLINIPLVILCLVLGIPSIKESRDSQPRKIDTSGAITIALSLAGLTYGLIQGPITHWGILSVVSLVVGGILALAFIKIESSIKDPMIKLSLFNSRNFTGSNLMTFGMYGALSGLIFALVIYLQTHLGYSSLKAGFSLFPVSVLMFFFAGRIGGLSAKYGPRFFMTLGPITASVGMLYLYFLKPGDSYLYGLLPGVILFAAGLVLTVAPLTTTVMTSLPESNSGIASGINNAVARTAGLVVIALLGLLGTNHVYQFALALSAGLALSSGLISFLVIRNFQLSKK